MRNNRFYPATLSVFGSMTRMGRRSFSTSDTTSRSTFPFPARRSHQKLSKQVRTISRTRSFGQSAASTRRIGPLRARTPVRCVQEPGNPCGSIPCRDRRYPQDCTPCSIRSRIRFRVGSALTETPGCMTTARKRLAQRPRDGAGYRGGRKAVPVRVAHGEAFVRQDPCRSKVVLTTGPARGVARSPRYVRRPRDLATMLATDGFMLPPFVPVIANHSAVRRERRSYVGRLRRTSFDSGFPVPRSLVVLEQVAC